MPPLTLADLEFEPQGPGHQLAALAFANRHSIHVFRSSQADPERPYGAVGYGPAFYEARHPLSADEVTAFMIELQGRTADEAAPSA